MSTRLCAGAGRPGAEPELTARRVALKSGPRGVLLVGHGTRDTEGRSDFAAFTEEVRHLAGMSPDDPAFAVSFLELAPPDPAAALLAFAVQGFARVTIVPALLFSAGHMKRDLPWFVAQARKRGLGISVELRDPVGVRPLFARAAAQRVCETELWRSSMAQRRRVGVLFVGRGTSDACALADLQSMAALTRDRLAADASDVDLCLRVCTMTGAVRTLEEGLEQLLADGVQAVIAAPYLLFRGMLTRRLGKVLERWRQTRPGMPCAAACTLGGHPDVVRAFADAVRDR